MAVSFSSADPSPLALFGHARRPSLYAAFQVACVVQRFKKRLRNHVSEPGCFRQNPAGGPTTSQPQSLTTTKNSHLRRNGRTSQADTCISQVLLKKVPVDLEKHVISEQRIVLCSPRALNSDRDINM